MDLFTWKKIAGETDDIKWFGRTLFLNPMKLWSELITASSSSSSQARNCWFWNLNSLRLGAHPLHLADSKANVLITFQLCYFILWIFGMFSLIVYCSLHKNMVLKSVIITFIIECNMQTFIPKFTISSWRNSQNLFSISKSALTENGIITENRCTFSFLRMFLDHLAKIQMLCVDGQVWTINTVCWIISLRSFYSVNIHVYLKSTNCWTINADRNLNFHKFGKSGEKFFKCSLNYKS